MLPRRAEVLVAGSGLGGASGDLELPRSEFGADDLELPSVGVLVVGVLVVRIYDLELINKRLQEELDEWKVCWVWMCEANESAGSLGGVALDAVPEGTRPRFAWRVRGQGDAGR